MNNCYDCDCIDECACGKKIIELKEYLPDGIYQQIKDIIIVQFECEYYEN